MEIKIEKITPQKAEEYLKQNVINRQLSKYRVKQYAYDMISDKWELNGEAIRFNEAGELIDGQHRLSAIVQSGKTISMVVMRNIPNDISVYDRGRTRNITDQLMMSGMSKAIANNSTVAIARLHYFVNGVLIPSDSLVREFLNKYEDSILKADELTTRSSTKSRISLKVAPIGLALIYALELDYDEQELKRWCGIVKDGFMSEARDSSAIVFRNDMISGAIDWRSSSTQKRKALHQAEKSITDFMKGSSRRISYVNWDTAIYSNNAKFKFESKMEEDNDEKKK